MNKNQKSPATVDPLWRAKGVGEENGLLEEWKCGCLRD